MQRTWRPGRVILAGLFVALAVAAYAYWPATVRWRLEGQDLSILGYSPARKQLLTTTNSFINSEDTQQRSWYQNERETISVYAHDITTGKKSFVQTIHNPSSSNTLMVLSPDGQTLAFADDGVYLYNIETGQQGLSIDTAGEQAAVKFSQDSQRLVVVTWKHIQVWGLVKQQTVFEVPFFLGLEQRLVMEKGNRSPNKSQNRPGCQAISLSKDNRYLAILMCGQLVTYDVAAERRIAQTPCTGIPKFLKDGSLGILSDEPTKGLVLKAKMDVRLNVLQVFPKDDGHSVTHFQCLQQGDDSYLAVEFSRFQINWPRWIPNSFRQSVNQLFENKSKTWRVSLHNLEKVDVEKQLTVPEHKIEVTESKSDLNQPTDLSRELLELRKSMAALRWSITSQPPFRSTLIENNNWVAFQDSQSIELWPLLTYWRPWYCWVTVAGLVLIAVYFVWYCRRGVVGR